jgi:hypothetical protein
MRRALPTGIRVRLLIIRLGCVEPQREASVTRRGLAPRTDGDASMPYDLAKHADLVGLAAHARLSWQHWFARARATRLGLSDDRYGGAYALDGAGTWRRRLAELKAQIHAIEAGA